ncbi:MAG TPA: DUF1249 domain-containing protein [Gammaproteobacteria bacterium]|nr:DUF1249 domain-containing protein [Gammaproteobacteria bacterium]
MLEWFLWTCGLIGAGGFEGWPLWYSQFMLISTTEQGLVIAPTRSFSGLMALYENNYLRLKRLLGRNGLPQSGKLISRVPADEALHLEIRERSRYTTTVRLTYWFTEEGFEDASVCVPDPDLMLKVYHDARMVEAWGCGPYHHHHLLRELPVNNDTSAPNELNRRWAMNSLLNKWLDYCYQQNHFQEYRSRETAK